MATRLLFLMLMRMILQSTLKVVTAEGGHRTAPACAFGRILVKAGISPADDVLLGDMTELAARTGGRITGVLPALPGLTADPLTEPWLERFRCKGVSAFIRPYWVEPYANATEVLLAYAQNNGSDLLGVAAAPTSVWRFPFVDPEVRTVCASSPSPVWVAGRHPLLTRASHAAPSIVAAVDLTSGSEPVVRFADMLAQALSAHLLIAHVLPEITEASLSDSLLYPDAVRSATIADERLAKLASVCTNRAETHVLRGDPVSQIKRLAADAAPAVILAGRRGMSGVGSTAIRLIRRPRYPVVIVPFS